LESVEEIEKEIKKLQEREARFGTAGEESKKHVERLQRKLDFAKHMEPPKPIEEGSTFNNDTLYLYGVDYMNTDNIKNHFNGFGEERNVTWINDSSCRV